MPNSEHQVGVSGRGKRWVPWVILGTICALVIGFFAWSARPGWLGLRTSRAEDAYYNLLVRGFQAGQLNLKTEVPAGLAHLADPYDPVARIDHSELYVDGRPLWDTSYYRGKLYLYFGVTPALVLFWPYAALTGHYLGHKEAVVVFCATGFLASFGLLCLVWRRCFPETGLAVAAAGTLALGLVVFTPIILPRAEIFEVAISCGYALTMLALLALWGACHQAHQRWRWLAAASLAYGLAVGARPNLLFGAVILLVPVALAWREGRMQKEEGRILLRRRGNLAQSQILVPLLAATGPITCIGLGLMLYNALRFDNPFEFGTHYQLSDIRMTTLQTWSHHWVGFNSWVYFLGPAGWVAHFPFVRDIKLPPLTAGHGLNEHPFGVLTNMPLVWLAVAAPLAWRSRSADVRLLLRGFVAAVALLFATRALTLCFFRSAHARYEMDFCPALVLLAVVGIFGLERALAGRPAWRRAARWGWGLLLVFSIAFNLLASGVYHAEYHLELGSLLIERGQIDEAIAHFQNALALQPDNAGVHNNLGLAFGKKGQTDEAIRQFQEAVRLTPDHAEAHNNLGLALGKQGQTDEAIRQYQEAIRLNPGYANAHCNLGIALDEKGQTDGAIRQYQEAIHFNPAHANAHKSLGNALAGKDQTEDAIHQFQEVIRLKPDDADTHNNLGFAFYLQRRTGEAIRQYQEALRLKPDFAVARKNLQVALDTWAHSSPPPEATTNR